jgi:hypothetical protein
MFLVKNFQSARVFFVLISDVCFLDFVHSVEEVLHFMFDVLACAVS